MKPSRNPFVRPSTVVAILLIGVTSAHAATVYWDGVTGNWSDVANWSTASGATTPNPGAVPTAGDTAIFNITTVDGDQTVYLNGNRGSTSSRIVLQFDNTGTTQLLGGTSATAANDILYSNNITINAGAGAVTIGDTAGSPTRRVDIQTGTNVFTNNSSSLFTIANGIRSVGTGSTTTLTFTGTGNTSILGQVNNGTLTNVVAITKTGAGTLTLSGNNIHSGATTISNGVVNIQHSNALGTTTGSTSVASGAALQIQGGITTLAEALSLNGTGISANGALRNISGNNSYGGLVTLAGATRINSDSGTLTLSNTGTITGATFGLTVGGAGNTTINSIIGTTTGTLTKDGAGILSLTRANTYSGQTTLGVSYASSPYVNDGILRVSNGSALGTGTLRINGGYQTASLELTGDITVANAITLEGRQGVSGNGPISNLSGYNTISGDINLVANGARIIFGSQAGNLTVSGTFSGTSGRVLNLIGDGDGEMAKPVLTANFGSLEKSSGTGTWTLSGANTYATSTTVTAGTLAVSGSGTLGNGASLTVNGGALDLGTTSQTVGAVSVSAAASSGDTIRNGSLTGTSYAASNAAGNAIISANLLVNGSAGFTKTGVGTVTLSGTNTFTGNVSLGTNSGTLRITNSSALGTGTKTVTNVSASSGSPGQSNALELDSNGGADINLASSISFSTSGSNGVILNTAGNNTINGNISMALGNGNTKIISNGGTLTLAGNISAAATDRVLDLAGSSIGNNEFSGVLSNGSTPSLLKSGAGKWILSGANTFRGTTTITGGTLALTNNLALQTSTLNTDFTGGGSLDLTGVNTPTIGALSGAGNLAMPSNLTSLTLNPQSGSASYSGNISGGTGMKLIKSGATGTTQTLSGTNTYTGATEIEVGALNIASNTALNGTSGVAITSTAAAGGILELANGVTITGKTVTISGYGSTTVRGSLRSASNATAEWAGPVVIGGVSSPADTRVGAMPNSTLTISGKISDGTLNTFIVSADAANGKVIVSGANDYTGQTQIFRGTLALGANNSLPTGSVLNVHSAASITDTATFDLNNYNQQVGGLLRGNTSGPAVVTNSGVNEKTLTIHNTGNHTFDSAITGNLALVKSGAGTQTLSGTSTYTGTTTVSAGTLVINGNISTSSTTVGSGGTLAGSGTTGSLTINNGGTLAPGNSPGTLTVSGDLGLNDESILAFEFDPFNTAVGGNINDLVTGISNFTLDGLLNVTATSGSFSGVTSGTWRLFEYSGSLTDNILTLNSMPSLASGYSWSLDTGTTGQVNLVVVPEPRAALLGGIGMLALLRRRRS